MLGSRSKEETLGGTGTAMYRDQEVENKESWGGTAGAKKSVKALEREGVDEARGLESKKDHKKGRMHSHRRRARLKEKLPVGKRLFGPVLSELEETKRLSSEWRPRSRPTKRSNWSGRSSAKSDELQ